MLKKYSPYILCFLIALLVTALYVNDFSPLVRLEWQIQDLLFSLKSSNPAHGDILLVDIDDRTLNEYGEWPWPNDRLGDLLAAIGRGNPQTVLLDMYINPDVSMDSTGATEVLAGQMSWMKNVIVSFDYAPAEYITGKIANPKYLFNHSMAVNNELGLLDDDETLLARKAFLPPALVCQYAAGIGFKGIVLDSDREVRWEPLALYYQGYYYPSAPLMAAAHYLNIPSSKIKIYSREYVQVGSKKIPINNRGNYFVNFNKPEVSFKNISAFDILNESVPSERFNDKLVIVSLNATEMTETIRTPVWSKMPSGRKTANVVENIIHGNYIKRVDSQAWKDILILLLAGIAFAFALPRVTAMQRGIILGSTFIISLMVTYFLFDSMKFMYQPLYLMLELTLLFFVGPLLERDYLERLINSKFGLTAEADKPKKKKGTGKPKVRVINEEKERVIIDDQSLNDTAFTPIPKAPAADVDQDNQGTIADGAEISATTAVPEPSDTVKPESQASEAMAEATPSESRDVPLEHAPVKPEEEIPEPQRPKASDDEVIIQGSSGPKEVKPDITNLGRYKVLSVLGKGAMGTVYKGTDPAIDRNVALKTIRLDFVNDPDELEELKVRLSREAKAAGMLSHNNIVTIYDVGAEGSLQYIAMEYLQGQTLEDMIRRKVKFNYKIIAQIITQICSALEYAHAQGIVHRDIKPANIMVLDNYRVKVMDFGIARVDSSSMTRTGIAMGTPNYISPEQLQGKKVDRRCDIFSLGVVMYEMLLHRRPFKGENLTSLIYSIVNTDPELPSTVDPSVPHLFDRVIEKALHKDPNERYQNAQEISVSLADFVESFAR